MDKNTCMIKKSTEAILDTSNEVGLEVNEEKSKNIFMSQHHSNISSHILPVNLKRI